MKNTETYCMHKYRETMNVSNYSGSCMYAPSGEYNGVQFTKFKAP